VLELNVDVAGERELCHLPLKAFVPRPVGLYEKKKQVGSDSRGEANRCSEGYDRGARLTFAVNARTCESVEIQNSLVPATEYRQPGL
jgi:hypothetical protein